ncbi:type II toxin-antitoxin system Phd/YefM family antitoxin [Krasilnikovia sp. M28-CT-15]
MHWRVQDAKQRFSEVVRAAESGEPQVVTRHGRDDLDPGRSRDLPRDIR